MARQHSPNCEDTPGESANENPRHTACSRRDDRREGQQSKLFHSPPCTALPLNDARTGDDMDRL
jgi:hypothetical protein